MLTKLEKRKTIYVPSNFQSQRFRDVPALNFIDISPAALRPVDARAPFRVNNSTATDRVRLRNIVYVRCVLMQRKLIST